MKKKYRLKGWVLWKKATVRKDRRQESRYKF